MITYATKDDIDEIKKLFDLCFFEDIEFNNWFFKNIFDYKTAILYKEKNKIVSMLQAIPYSHSVIGDVTYIYGACTSHEYRKKGLMEKLLNFSFKEDLKNNKNASVLIPANTALFDFYKKFGYETAFYIEDTTEALFYVNTNLTLEKATAAFADELLNIYDTALKNKSYIYRNSNYFKTQINMFYNFGGQVYLLKENNNTIGYCFMNTGEIPFIQEILTVNNSIYLEQFKSLLFELVNKNKLRFVTYGNYVPFGCIKYHNLKMQDMYGYMNLMFN